MLFKLITLLIVSASAFLHSYKKIYFINCKLEICLESFNVMLLNSMTSCVKFSLPETRIVAFTFKIKRKFEQALSAAALAVL